MSKTPDNIAVQNDLALVYSSLRDPRALPLAEKVYARQPKAGQIAKPAKAQERDDISFEWPDNQADLIPQDEHEMT